MEKKSSLVKKITDIKRWIDKNKNLQKIIHFAALVPIDKVENNKPLVQIITIDEQSQQYGLDLLLSLRNLQIKTKYDFRINIKKSLKNANEENIKFAIIVGTSELKNKNYTLKNLVDGTQNTLSFEDLLKILQS